MIHFWSDPHFYHENIVRFCHRPFKNVNKMNAVLIQNFNRCVTKDDTVFVLGDLGMKISPAQLRQCVEQLNGHKILIPGNHEKFPVHDYYDMGFAGVFGHLHITINNQELYLAHDPCWAQIPNTTWVCGHVHNLWKKLVALNNTTIVNASVEVWDYKPFTVFDLFDCLKHDEADVVEKAPILDKNKRKDHIKLEHFYHIDLGECGNGKTY